MNEETELELELEKERKAEEYLDNLKRKSWFVEVTKFLAIAIIFPTIVYFCVGTAIIDGGSMNPTYENGQRAILNKTSFYFSDGDYGDIVVFRPIEGYPSVFVKRLIGKPGDTIEVKDNTVLRNGEKLVEPYINEPMLTEDMSTLTLNESQYFFMGDNRNHSTDSRVIGPIDKSLIIGELMKFSNKP